ncbi:indolepyruvate oxidoreductase subunit beta family protein [Rhodopseudomonas sp.]|uniref:indolepyruvate oxidoreductase subunit beta family protein n=1 Tax=Rhodopseudomonas sp. TaxID=1078 RepID=UPI0025D10510|nr:indolepyruvate oxidoreductase subunit beta family protein [Rhodopseudomonas sp.]
MIAQVPQLDTVKPITIAVLAMGGQGGGVLVDWIVALAESQGWIAQSTSVPGVAQRTGATIYSIELIAARAGMPYPVLSLMPVPGEVDIVLGAELMEAGRAIQRGLVTPERTTLLASSHRSYAVREKQVPGNGIGAAAAVYQAAGAAAKRFIVFDMAAIADATGSAISAVMFGALAGSGALPFPRSAYEETIRAAGVGVEPSLRAFREGFDGAGEPGQTRSPPLAPNATPDKRFPELAPVGHPGYDALVQRARAIFPGELHGMLAAGLQRVVDYQDIGYGAEYLDLVASFESFGSLALTGAAAKYIAVAMAYDDVIRVADLKTRSTRVERIRREILAKPEQLVQLTEYMHPRAEEVVGVLPAALGRWLEARPRAIAAIDRIVNRGRRVRTDTLRWFLALSVIAGLRRFRRGMWRHAQEIEHRDAWLAAARAAAAIDPTLAVEILQARRLVKGYSDTHARGQSKFDKVMAAAIRLQGRPDAAQWVQRLCRAALADEDGTALDGALATIESFLR